MAIAPRRPGLIFFIFIRTFITFISRLAAGWPDEFVKHSPKM
jgi:hypothetical protein